MPHLLQLFSGTGSIGNVFRARGWQVTSVDLDARFNPEICCNVLHLTPEMITTPPDVIWASPPCTHYSRARTTAKTPRDLEGSDAVVAKTLEIISWFDCMYFMENPMGMMRHRPIVQGLTRKTTDYCQYADDRFPRYYRKRTDIWTNTAWNPLRGLCNKQCRGCDEHGRHTHVAQRIAKGDIGGNTLHELYAIPPALAEEICNFVEVQVRWEEETRRPATN